jgi:beta-lactamase class A
MLAVERGICDLASGFSGKLTLALTDLQSGEHIALDEDEPMPAASVIKLPILVSLYQASEAGRIRVADRLRYEERHRTGGTGVMKDLGGGIEMTIRDAAVLMVIVSDNCATDMIIEVLGGFDGVNAAFADLGLARTTLKPRHRDPPPGPDPRNFSLTTASETCALLERIARREVASAEVCDDILSILRSQQYRDKLARNLPWNVLNVLPDPESNWVASKDGMTVFNSVRNDAAIMHGPRGEVAIAAFTEGATGSSTGLNQEGNVLLGQIGELVWRTVCA